jgi:hypothetical protein
MRILKRLTVVVAVSASVFSASADTVYYGINQVFNGGFSSPSRSVARVYQMYLDDTNFSNLATPTVVNGLRFRLPGGANTTYPVGNLTFTQYDISIGLPSVAAQTAQTLTSTTFDDNYLAPITARSGALSIPAGSFTDNGTGVGDDTAGQGNAEFSFFIPFTTPVTLTPGVDYVMLIRHSGYTSTAGTETQWNFDAFTYTAGSVVNTTSVNGTTGSSFNSVNKFAFSEVPEPSGLALLGIAAVAVFRRPTRASNRFRGD